MSVDKLINLLACITLLEMMLTIGLGVTFPDVAGVARDWRMVGRAALANYVIVPVVAVALLVAFRAQPMVAAGFLIAAVCPGAPYAPPFTAIARGNVVLSVGLMVILAGSSAVLAPLLLRALLPFVAGSEPLKIDAARMVSTLALSQFLPLCAGLFLRNRNPALSARLKAPLTTLSKLLNLLLIGAVLAVHFQMLASIRPAGYLGMLALVAATVSAGWLLGGPRVETRRTMAMTTAVRNVGVSLVIATSSFPGTAAVTAATAYALFQTIVLALVALGWGHVTLRKAVAGVPNS